ncbi:MAG: LON peptidase substrate-binding domain-containing protein [Candidatus Solibacter usitatus]|nr:LON peptidase substrate-binding domain-containing protein [Candidatus Solibacter usitatus]
MRDVVLPLFPLPLVLLPRTPLPLHIFEDRYKEMIGEAIAAGSEFGITRARDQEMDKTGCTARVQDVVKRYEDGRMDIVARGVRRFRIRELLAGKSYLQARVEFFEDEDLATPSTELRQKAMEAFTQTARLGSASALELELDDPQLSFQIGRIIDDNEFLQEMLLKVSEPERLQMLVEFLPLYVARKRHVEQVRAAAPRNGKSKISPVSF